MKHIVDDSPIVIDAESELHLRHAIEDREQSRTPFINELTRRVLTRRAQKLSDEENAAAEGVEVQTLRQWLASPHRTPTEAETEQLVRHELPALAMQNTAAMLGAGDRALTLEILRQQKRFAPPKQPKSVETKILVGVGLSAVGRDPVEIALAVKINQ